MVNLKDLAEVCNTSLSTVSRAIRNTGYVNPQLKEKILQTADQLGYIPNCSAQQLRSGKSNTIGIIVSDIKNFFYSIVLGHLVESLREQDYQVLIGYSFENAKTEAETLSTFLANRVDAVILTPVSNENQELIDIIKLRKIPILQLYRNAYPELDALVVDDSYGAYLSAKHLLSLGYTRIALLSVNVRFTPHRSEGFQRAHKECGVPVQEGFILKLPPDQSTTKPIMQFISQREPDAIIAGTNILGLDALKSLKEMKIPYNSQMGFVVFDDMQWLEFLDVTTVSQPIDIIYKKCVDLIISKLNSKLTVAQHEVKVMPSLIVRG